VNFSTKIMRNFVGKMMVTWFGAALLFASTSISAGVIVSTDFGLASGAPNTDISPFTTDYTPNIDPTGQGEYEVNTTGRSFGDWGGVDHTTSVDNFMIMNGANDSNRSVLSYTVAAANGVEYTISGFIMNVLSGGGGPAVLSFRVAGVEQSTYTVTGAQIWNAFEFSFVAAADGPVTIALHDNNTSTSANDFGLDDIQIEDAVVSDSGPVATSIPTLNQYGLAMLILAVFGMGFVGFRRYF